MPRAPADAATRSRSGPAPGPPLRGLPAVADAGARVLVLGSMPGVESLRLQQYYAHPRNHFWPIAGELFDAGLAQPYAERLVRLRAAGIAVWDVLAECVRPGSLDSAIAASSIRVNDFAGFFTAHPRLRAVFCNGTFADTTFRARVLRAGVALPAGVAVTRLPSTSPANASVPFAAKLQAWRALAEAAA